MRRLALAVLAAGCLFTASRSEAQTSYTLDAFTFSVKTKALAGSIGCTINSDICIPVNLTATAGTVFYPIDPNLPPNPISPGLEGLFTAWDALYPTDPLYPVDPFYGLLVALGRVGARALVTTFDGTTIASIQPLWPGDPN